MHNFTNTKSDSPNQPLLIINRVPLMTLCSLTLGHFVLPHDNMLWNYYYTFSYLFCHVILSILIISARRAGFTVTVCLSFISIHLSQLIRYYSSPVLWSTFPLIITVLEHSHVSLARISVDRNGLNRNRQRSFVCIREGRAIILIQGNFETANREHCAYF